MIQIAICDDEKIHRILVRDALDRFCIKYPLDYEVLEFSSGKDLLNNDKPFDILLLDISLGDDLDGIDIGEQLRLRGIAAPIILITSFDRYKDGYRASVHRYLEKPVEQAAFDEALSSAIRLQKDREHMLDVTYRREHHLFRLDDIDYITARGHLRIISVVSKGDTVAVKSSWDEITAQLPETFFPVQDHVIVNFAYVTGYSKTEVSLRSGLKFRIARRCFPDFEKARNQFVLRKGDSQ